MTPSVRLGMRLRFVPTAFSVNTNGFREVLTRQVTGTVTYINREHRYFLTEWQICPGCIGRECFKF